MTSSLFLFVAIALAVLAWFFIDRSRRDSERRRRIASDWGRALDARGELEEIALYHRLLPHSASSLDDRTWADLDLDSVYREIDRCRSAPGQQTLYRRLREQQHEDGERFENFVDRMDRDAALRNDLQGELSRLSSREAYYLPHLMLDELPAVSKWRWLYPVLSVLLVVAGIASFFTPAAILVFGAAIVANVAIQMRYRSLVLFYVRPLRFVRLLLDVATAITSPLPSELRSELSQTDAALEELRSVGRFASWLNFDDSNGNDLIAMARQYANMFLLLDVIALAFSIEGLRQRQGSLHTLFRTVGFVDAAISVASVRAGTEVWCRPTSGAERIEAKGLRHPALQDAVPNDALFARSVLVTGSNMSGKSTYLRTVGVNVVLAQSIQTAFATSYRAPRLEVTTSIGRADSLLEGKSYYLAEVQRIGELLQRRNRDVRQLFILDELFRGTNTTERIAASYGVLHHLDEGGALRHFTLVATHDLELAPMLRDEFDAFHFREMIADGELSFDYTLTPGVSSTRNAIAILELMQFPAEVVADARSAADASQA